MHGIALGGFMGVGKSTVGAALADRVGLPFMDTDQVLVQRHGPIAEQFADHGEAVFRERERAVVAEIAAGAPCVLATGGGVWVDRRNRDALRGWGRLIVLHAPLPVLRERLGSEPGRPLWDDALQARFDARQEAYADADLRLDTSTRTVDALVEEILKWLP